MGKGTGNRFEWEGRIVGATPASTGSGGILPPDWVDDALRAVPLNE